MNSSILEKRLSFLWKKADFISFFEKSSKKPPHTLKKGTILLNEGDPLERLYCITEGFIKLYRLSKEGKDTTVYLFGPGNVLGLRALTSEDGCTRHTAETLTNAKVLTMSKKEYFDALLQHPEFLVDFAYMALERLNYTERKLEGFIIADTTSRVANFLYDVMVRFCKKSEKSVELPLPLTHQRIAEFVGSLRETVTGAIQKLEKEKVIQSTRSKVVILNKQRLIDYAFN